MQQESLQLLDWPAVCIQVACFAATPMAADQLLQSGLPMGASQVNAINTSLMLPCCEKSIPLLMDLLGRGRDRLRRRSQEADQRL